MKSLIIDVENIKESKFGQETVVIRDVQDQGHQCDHRFPFSVVQARPHPYVDNYIKLRHSSCIIIYVLTSHNDLKDRRRVVAVAVATPSQPTYGYTPEPTYEEPAKYDFNYAVKDDYSGNDFGHQEARDGYNTQGSYYVLLPDGRLQKVTYTVNGDSGYVAEVSYEGEASTPSTNLLLPTSLPCLQACC
nr:cuticle protein 19.8-like [Penaeus vannamei]